MSDMIAKHVIEALRSGVPSRTVGRYFTESRPKIMKQMTTRLDETCDGTSSSGMIIRGKYGEGKTHLLNTVFNMASERNMVVSMVSLSKETPFNNFAEVYGKLMANTYLPSREQPGFLHELEERLSDSKFTSDLSLFASTELECNKLYFILKTLLREEDEDMKVRLEADLMGDFMTAADWKKEYRKLYHEPAKPNMNFLKRRHVTDYIRFMSALFEKLGYRGWVILFDEAELIGRSGKKARLAAYDNMSQFLMPSKSIRSVFTLFAFTASYPEDVIESKHDYENLAELFPDNEEPMKSVLNQIVHAQQLVPLTSVEMHNVIDKIIDFHTRAYDWNLNVDRDYIIHRAEKSGALLRTKLRTAIELLDQLYQYGEVKDIHTETLMEESFEEEDIPDLLSEIMENATGE